MLVGVIVFALSYAVLTQAEMFTMFLVAMIILTVGEMFVWPAVPSIANELAPEGKSGFYQGIVNSVSTGGRMVGPFIGGLIVDMYSMHTLLFVLIGLLILSLPVLNAYDAPLKRLAKANDDVAG